MRKKKKAVILTLITILLIALLVAALWGEANKNSVVVYIFAVPFVFALALAAIAEWRGKDFTKSFGSANVPSLNEDKRKRH